jgi:large subunit ribosomal protein L9
MKVILTENVKALGNTGDIVNVSMGFARNYLIPNKFAILADASNKKQMADYEKMLAKKIAEQKAAAQDVAAKLKGLTINLVKKVGGSGALFGTVTNTELAKELEKQGIVLERRLIELVSPIKNLGTFDVKAKIFKGVEAVFKVKVEIDPVQAEELKKQQESGSSKKAAKAAAKAAAEAAAAEATETTEE